MRWQLEWGKFASFLSKRAARGLPTPVWDNRPVLYEDIQWVWEAFTDLSASRQSGFDVNPISFHDILSWVEMMGVTDSDDRQELVFLLRVMDSSWVEWARKKTNGDSTTGDRRNKG